jgi:hypothetical protein
VNDEEAFFFLAWDMAMNKRYKYLVSMFIDGRFILRKESKMKKIMIPRK